MEGNGGLDLFSFILSHVFRGQCQALVLSQKIEPGQGISGPSLMDFAFSRCKGKKQKVHE
jgi:hypothetical protein